MINVGKLPVFIDRVITADRSGLVNGNEFIRVPKATARSGDKLFILPADAGG